MAYNVTASYLDESRKISGTFPVDMYAVNASPTGVDYLYYVNLPHNAYGFQLDSNGDLIATEQLYTGLRIKRGELSSNVQGEIAGISLSVPNTDRTIEAIIQDKDYLRGCDVHLISFFAKYLPSGATYDYIGTSSNHNTGFKEKYYIDSVTSNEEVVTFECKSKFDIRHIVIPGRRFTRECSWDYESAECGVSATVAASWTSCDRTLEDCRERSNEARFGGYPSVPKRAFVVVS